MAYETNFINTWDEFYDNCQVKVPFIKYNKFIIDKINYPNPAILFEYIHPIIKFAAYICNTSPSCSLFLINQYEACIVKNFNSLFVNINESDENKYNLLIKYRDLLGKLYNIQGEVELAKLSELKAKNKDSFSELKNNYLKSAISCYMKTVELFQKCDYVNDSKQLLKAHTYIGNIQVKLKDISSAIENYNESLSIIHSLEIINDHKVLDKKLISGKDYSKFNLNLKLGFLYLAVHDDPMTIKCLKQLENNDDHYQLQDTQKCQEPCLNENNKHHMRRHSTDAIIVRHEIDDSSEYGINHNYQTSSLNEKTDLTGDLEL